MISIPHKTKQFLVLLIKLLIVMRLLYFTISWQIRQTRLGSVSVLFKKNQRLQESFILLLSVLE
jgi:hypothetical protein